jgi:transmembrane sensor
MSKERFEFLFQKYLLKNYSPAEREEFFILFRQPENQAILQTLSEKYPVPLGNDAPLDDAVAKEILEAVLSGSGSIKILEAPVSKMHFTKKWGWAAAAVLILLGAGTYFLTQHHESNIQPPLAQKVDVAPGGNHAFLTLANGSKIMLDSAANGSLAKQGTTDIIKSDSGKLLYSLVNLNSPLSLGRGAGGEGKPLYNTLTTPNGGQYQLTLPDGTKVWLNAASSITYPTTFTGNERMVSMTGEAYFEVAKDPARRFKVRINEDALVEVFGTHFNIDAYSDEPVIAATLIEGNIHFEKLQGNKNDKHTSADLRPGQQAELTRVGALTLNVRPDLDQVMAWKEGFFQFDHSDLKTIMRQLSRWYNIEVEFKGDIPDREFFGRLNRNLPLSSVLTILKANNIHYEIQMGNKLVIQP